MLFNTLAGAFTQLSKMNWVPQQGWAYTGGDWTVAMKQVSENPALSVKGVKGTLRGLRSLEKRLADRDFWSGASRKTHALRDSTR
jgi:hypothetical protein